jgi:translocation and assembly module TamB
MDAGRLHARGLRLRSGQSEITADGHLQGAAGLSFRADIASLGDLVDGGTGRLAGEGMISLAAGNPKLRLDGSGRDLAWGSLSIGEVDVETTGAGSIHLEAKSLTVGETPITSLALTASGQRPLERLEAELVVDETEARLGLEGGVVDWQVPLAKGWQGRLVAARVDNPGLGFVELQQPSALRLGPDGVVLDEACFENAREGRLCVDSRWRTGGDRGLDVVLVDVSPNLALQLLGSDLQFSQRLSGEVHWRQRPPAEPEAQVRLDVSPGHVTVAGEDDPVLATGAGVFGFEIGAGRLHSGHLAIPLTGVGAGSVDIDFGVPNLAAGAGATLEGRLRIDLDDIEPVLSLVPGLDGSSGPVAADLQVGGTVTDPELTGHVSLVRGRVSHFASGLLLQDIRLGGAVYAYDQTEIHGSFRSGEGLGTVRAVVNFGDPLNPELLVELEGENLTLIDVPDLRVTANPDLRVTWREGAVGIDGRVLIPSARLSPRFLPTATAAESEDVVIVAGDRHLLQQPVAAPVEHRIRGELELELGNDVQLQLDRATALLRGTAQFNWDGQLVPVATGSFAVTGEIKAYGQLLEVTDGRVNFSGRPADNPFLNVRAEREIYGNTQVTKAGVHVTGTVKQPDLEVYTVPMTTRERALTLLVTGSDFNYEQGVGSVEVGMYVAPKLYISYGIGLFDEQNVISARYDLGKGFGIKTTSGQRETGADISYTIER